MTAPARLTAYRPAALDPETVDLGEPPSGWFDDVPSPTQDRRQPGPKRFDLIAFDDIRLSTAPNYAIKGLLPRVGLAVIWGPPKCGKSFFVSDLLLHVALGWAYRGRRVNQAAVVYCCLEGADGFSNRMIAFRHAKLAGGSEPVPFYISPTPLNLVMDHPALIGSIRERLGDVIPGVVVLDTLNRSLAGSESSDEDMGAYVKAADALRDAFKCLVVVVHHCGLDATRPRGHTSLTGALDVQIAVKKAGDLIVSAMVEYNKDGPEGAEVVSRLVPVEIGTDDDGDQIGTLVVEPIDAQQVAAARPVKAIKLTDGERLGLEALHAACLDIGRSVPASFGINPSPRGVKVDAWRAEMKRRGVLDGEGSTPRSKFARIKDGLFAKHRAAERDGIVWPCA